MSSLPGDLVEASRLRKELAEAQQVARDKHNRLCIVEMALAAHRARTGKETNARIEAMQRRMEEARRASAERIGALEDALTALLATADECAWCEEPATHASQDGDGPFLTCDACAEPGHVELGRAAAVRAARAAIGAEHGMAVAGAMEQR